MRTRFTVVMMAIVALFVAQEASAETGGVAGVMQDALTGSVRKAVTVAVAEPEVNSPLLEWMRVAEQARLDRENWKSQQNAAEDTDSSDPDFTRDRD